jgi:5-methylcytosine-specific restriction protein A
MQPHSKEFWLVAFFLSKFGERIENKGTQPPVELNTILWRVAYKKFFQSLGEGKTGKTFEHGLKNCRDAYDGHTGTSARKGWRDGNRNPVKLSSTAKSVYKKYNLLGREKIWQEVQKYVSDDTKPNTKIKMISDKKTNPDWTREELILALDLYYELDQGQMHKGHPEVIRISNELRALGIHKTIPDIVKFRNPSSVSRRLGNFKTMDSGYKGEGLPNSGKLAKEVFEEFANRRDKLRKEASIVRQLYLKSEAETSSAAEPRASYNSEFIFQYHKNRETDPLVMKVKKEMVLFETKKLKCEICGFDSLTFYGEIGNDLMEIHYNKEPQNEPNLEVSDMNDFVIVCSNCHKVLDKNFGLLNSADLKKISRKK